MKRLLKTLGRRPIVVVTDRYPPDARGGAELSLHIALRALPEPQHVLVVTMQGNETKPRTYEIDGISVLVLPGPGRWPNHTREQQASVLPTFGSTGFPTEGLSEEDVDALETAKNRHKPRGGVVCDFAEYPHAYGIRQLREVIEACRPAVIHADNYRSILRARLASEGLDVRRVGVVRDNRFHCVRHNQAANINDQLCGECDLACAAEDSPKAPHVQEHLLRRTRDFRQESLRAFDRVIVTSRFLHSKIAPITGEACLVRIPVTPEKDETVAPLTRGVAELPGMNLLIVGMVNENKGQLHVARRLDALVREVPDAVVHLAGRGERVMKGVRRAAADVDLSERIVEHGFLDRASLYALYRKCQIVLLPTIWTEGFGRVPLEAGMARRPVVSFEAGGLAETILDGQTGFLVPHGDFSALFARAGRLARDAGLRHRMGRKGHEHISGLFDVERTKQELLATWRDLGVAV